MTKRWTAELQKPLSCNFLGGRLAVSLRNGTLTNQFHHYCVVAPKDEGDHELCSLKVKWDHHQHRRRVSVSPASSLLPAGYPFSRWFSAKRMVLWERLTNAGVLFSLLRRAMIKIATKRFGFSPVMKVISSVTAEEKKVCACVNHGTLKAKLKFKASRSRCSAENGRRLAGINLTSTPTEALPPRQKAQIVCRSHNRELLVTFAWQ